MPYSSNPDLPLSELSGDQVRGLATMPISSAEMLYEIYCEIARRRLTDSSEILSALKQRFVRLRQRELSLELSALDRVAAGDSEHPLIASMDTLAAQLRSGQYKPLLRVLIELLLLPTERVQLESDELIPSPLNRRTTAEACKRLIEKCRDRKSTFLPIELEAFKLAEEAASYQPPPDADGRAHSAPQTPPAPAPAPGSAPTPAPAITRSASINRSPQKKIPSSWEEAVKQVRHAQVHPEAKNIKNLRGNNDWAEVSPLKMLGYSVDAKDGLTEREREEFLIDFCESAELPANLPPSYLDPWGKPGTKTRIHRTAKHIGFVKRNFEKQDFMKYSRAISAWRRDFEFLQKRYGKMLSYQDWNNAAKGL